MRLIYHVSSKLRDPNLEMFPILSMQLNVSVSAEEGKLRVVLRQYLELYNLRV